MLDPRGLERSSLLKQVLRFFQRYGTFQWQKPTRVSSRDLFFQRVARPVCFWADAQKHRQQIEEDFRDPLQDSSTTHPGGASPEVFEGFHCSFFVLK